MSEGIRVVFDLDGTLIDSAPDICAVAGAVLEAEGRAPLSLAETRDFIGSGAGAFVARMRAARDLPEDREPRLLEAFLARYEGAVDHTVLYDGVMSALGELVQAGHRLGLCTNKPIAPTRAVLRHFGMASIFTAVVGGDSLSARKPDPAPLRAALERMGGGAALYVGDSEIDARTAAAAGVPFILRRGGYAHLPAEEMGAAAAFDDFADLPGIVARMA